MELISLEVLEFNSDSCAILFNIDVGIVGWKRGAFFGRCIRLCLTRTCFFEEDEEEEEEDDEDEDDFLSLVWLDNEVAEEGGA